MLKSLARAARPLAAPVRIGNLGLSIILTQCQELKCDETSNGASRCATEERDGAVVLEVEAESPIEKKVHDESPATEAANDESPENEHANEFLDKLNIKFPKVMVIVGLGYTLWFTTRYLLYKKNRDELAAKVEEIKQQVLGSID